MTVEGVADLYVPALDEMTMLDIRDKVRLNHSDILHLNFVRSPGYFVFRRYYRSGLRSHIMAVLRPEDVKKEKNGVQKNGVTWFPKAKPLKMLRVFRKRFGRLEEAMQELNRVKMVEKYLAPEYMARSSEFLVDYRVYGKYEMLLCGLQEYVEGEILDPWGPLDQHSLWALFCRMAGHEEYGSGLKEDEIEKWVEAVRRKAEKALLQIRKMIREARLIPDLAGIGNLVLTPSGGIKVVDINNISEVSFEADIFCDDKGYPVCDKSVEALFLMEQKLLGCSPDETDPVYGFFLDAGRMKKVQVLEKVFHQAKGFAGSSYPV
ncbi:MAG: hypothetical protein GY846_27175 [Deltaproteobacteria bacterium]|nr:hypothetical protein [Deltaproteobacteria bacterium]